MQIELLLIKILEVSGTYSKSGPHCNLWYTKDSTNKISQCHSCGHSCQMYCAEDCY